MKRSVMMGIVVLGATLVAQSASARSIPGFAGQAEVADQTPCFGEFYGAVVSIANAKTLSGAACPVSPTWEVGLPCDNANSKSVTIGYDNINGTQLCAVISANNTLGIFSWTGWIGTPAGRSTLPFAAVSLPSNGTLFLACQMQAGSYLMSANWNP